MFVISRALLCLKMKINVGQTAIAGSKLEDGERGDRSRGGTFMLAPRVYTDLRCSKDRLFQGSHHKDPHKTLTAITNDDF